MTHLGVGFVYPPDSWRPDVRIDVLREGRPQPEVHLTDDSNQRQARQEKQRVPAGQAQRATDCWGVLGWLYAARHGFSPSLETRLAWVPSCPSHASSLSIRLERVRSLALERRLLVILAQEAVADGEAVDIRAQETTPSGVEAPGRDQRPCSPSTAPTRNSAIQIWSPSGVNCPVRMRAMG